MPETPLVHQESGSKLELGCFIPPAILRADRAWNLQVTMVELTPSLNGAKITRTGDALPMYLAVGIPFTGIVLSEWLLYFGYPWAAIWGHVFTFLSCILIPLRLKENISIWQVFALIPVFRLVNLGMPSFLRLTVYWYPFIYGPMIPALYLLARRKEDLLLKSNIRETIRQLPLLIPLSAVLAAVEYQIIQPDMLIPRWSLVQLLLLTVVMTAFVGFVEEILYRGFVQQTLTKQIGASPAVLLASILFGMMHSIYGNPYELLVATGIGCTLGLLYLRTRNLAQISVLHGFLNVFLFGIFPAYTSNLIKLPGGL